jgi:hypothetical protein
MNDAQFRLSEAQRYTPQYKNTLQEPEKDVYIQENRPQAPKPDNKALAWQDKNDWFGKDEEMDKSCFRGT